jgi:HAE1 family hydrophobic/amphiphilic exporter-1
MARIDAAMNSVVGVRLFMQAVQDVNIGGRLTATQYQYTLTDVDLAELDRWAPLVQAALAKLPQLTDLTSDQQSAAPQLMLTIDRQTASRLGVTPASIDAVLYDAFGQRPIAQLYTSLNQYYVIMQAKAGLQMGPDALRRIYVRSQTSGMVPLSELVTLHQTVTPLSVNHQGQFPSVTLSFNLQANEPLGTAVAAIQAAMADLHLPATLVANFQGNAQAFQSSLSSTPILILAALIAVYIVLGMLYEKTIHPPDHPVHAAVSRCWRAVNVAGVRFWSRRDGSTGIILPIGIVKKNGIMLVDFALHTQREQHRSAEDAIHEACLLRFRPILMTTMCALLGGLPLMLSNGTGSALRKPLGYAIVGGLIVSQCLTLFTTPIIYIYVDELVGPMARLCGRRQVPAVPAE